VKKNRTDEKQRRGCQCLYRRGAEYLLDQAAVTTMNEYEVIGQKKDVNRYLMPRLSQKVLLEAKRLRG
jgi:hypothetical protein